MPEFPRQINPLASVLTQRHITAEEAVSLELAVHSGEQIGDMLGKAFPKWLQGTFLPYHDVDGEILLTQKKTVFCRWRLENKDGSALKSDQLRYLQPPGSGVAAYLPVIRDIPWKVVAHDTSIRIWFTEGEFKAIRAVQEGLMCIGLGGVDNWHDREGRMARPLDVFQWQDREVFVCFDADPESCPNEFRPLKPSVEAAFQRFTARLSEMGAKVYRVSIAYTEIFKHAREQNVNVKMGIDDFFDAGGTQEGILHGVEPVIHNLDYARLLREYAIYSMAPLKVVRLRDGEAFTVSDFKTGLEVGAITMRMVQTPAGKMKVEKVLEYQRWLESKDRLIIDEYVFRPDEIGGYNSTDQTFNVWKGFKIPPRCPETIEEKQRYTKIVEYWKKLLRGLFDEEDVYVEKWFAHILQRPAERTSIAVLLMSKFTGIGKTILGELMISILGDRAGIAMDLDRTMKDFNALLEKRLFLQIDEANGRFSGHESKLDDLVTAKTVVIEHKGRNAYLMSNFARVYLTSNALVPIRIKETNRRFLVCEPSMTIRDLPDWRDWVDYEIAKIGRSKEDLGLLHWYLSRVDLTGWNPTANVPITKAMRMLADLSVTHKEEVSDHLLEALKLDVLESPDGNGYWIVTSDLKAQDKMVWGNLIRNVRANGGQTLAHQWRIGGKRFTGTVLDLSGGMSKKFVDEQWWVEGVSGTDAAAAAGRAAKAYMKWKDGAGMERERSDKY